MPCVNLTVEAIEQATFEYTKTIGHLSKQVEKSMDAAFDDDLFCMANILIIGPAINFCGGAYENSLPPVEFLNLMLFIIRTGQSEASNAWEKNVNQVTGGKFLNVLMSVGPGQESWALGIDFDPYTKRVQEKANKIVQEYKQAKMQTKR